MMKVGNKVVFKEQPVRGVSYTIICIHHNGLVEIKHNISNLVYVKHVSDLKVIK